MGRANVKLQRIKAAARARRSWGTIIIINTVILITRLEPGPARKKTAHQHTVPP